MGRVQVFRVGNALKEAYFTSKRTPNARKKEMKKNISFSLRR